MSVNSKLGVGQRQGDCWDLLASQPSWGKIKKGGGGMTGQVKAPAARYEDLNWISGNHVVQGENCQAFLSLWQAGIHLQPDMNTLINVF